MLRARLSGLVTSGPKHLPNGIVVNPEAQQVLSTLRKGDGVCAEGAIKEFTEIAGGIHSFWLLEVDWLGEINRVFDPKRLQRGSRLSSLAYYVPTMVGFPSPS